MALQIGELTLCAPWPSVGDVTNLQTCPTCDPAILAGIQLLHVNARKEAADRDGQLRGLSE
jgi:hypothetical protein